MVLMFTCLFISLTSYPDSWIQKTNFGGTARSDGAGCVIGGKGYLGTGYSSGVGFTKDWWEYDTLTDTWTQKANFIGTATVEATCVSILGKAYLLPYATNNFYSYDPVTNSWSLKASFPGQVRQGGIGFNINDKGYFGLGADPSLANHLNDLWEYNSITDNWTQKASLPGTARVHAAAFVIGSFGYIGTGIKGIGLLSDFWQYDPLSNNWNQKGNFPGGAIYEGSGFAIAGFGYLGGGYNSSGVPVNAFWRYNPATDSWNQIANFSPGGRVEMVCFSIGNYGYLGTGWDGTIFNNDFWKYSPDSLLSAVPDMAPFSYDFQFYYNPATGSLSITISDLYPVHLLISDITGKIILNDPNYISGKSVSSQFFAMGCYLIGIRNKNRNQVKKKFIQ